MLDVLIDRGGKVNASTAPILMPTDLLFEYGSDQLAEDARLSLMKLGLLIQRNPTSRFIVEGHTDTFGTDEFNYDLSQRRANAVVTGSCARCGSTSVACSPSDSAKRG